MMPFGSEAKTADDRLTNGPGEHKLTHAFNEDIAPMLAPEGDRFICHEAIQVDVAVGIAFASGQAAAHPGRNDARL